MSDALAPRSITETGVALDHFTDRHEAIRRFAEYLNTDPVPETVLFFHGEGGNGKSLLTRFINERCTKRLPPEKWNEAAAKTGDAFTRYIVQAEPRYAVPSARIDLRYGAENVLELLLSISHQLAPSGIRFPLFTFACIQYWKASRQLTPDLVKSNFPNVELDLAVALADDLMKLAPGASTALAFFRVVKHRLGPRFDDYASRRKLGNDVVDTIGEWEEGELYRKLPLIFAEDLNAAMRAVDAPKRVVLIIDTYEKFWGTPRNVVPKEHPERDAWFRLLLSTIDRTAGIVIVVAGRETPWWDELPRKERVPVESLEIGEFRDHDARAYLERLPAHDPAIRTRLIELARVGPDRVHPLLLGLAADIAILGFRNGENVIANLGETSEDVHEMLAILLRHLLTYCDDATRYAIRALAACRWFSITHYQVLGDTSGFEASARFAALTSLSFIQRSGTDSPDGQQTYVMHDLLRRLIRGREAAAVQAAHEQLERYYRLQIAPGASIEAIYHANQLDWERGTAEWVSQFEVALGKGQHAHCRGLIDLRADLDIPSPWWRARTLTLMAEFASRLSDHVEAETNYLASTTIIRDLITEHPGQVRNLSLLGNTLYGYGQLLCDLDRRDEAEDAFDEAISCYDEAIELGPGDPVLHDDLATAYRTYGDLHRRNALHRSAMRAYEQSLRSFDDALRYAPDDRGILSNRAVALVSRASLLIDMNRPTDALPAYELAIADMYAALDDIADSSGILNNLALLLEAYGTALAETETGESDEIALAFELAISNVDRAISVAPEHPGLLVTKSAVLRSFGDRLRDLDHIAAAQEAYTQSAACSDDALRIAPQSIPGMLSRGVSLTRLAYIALVSDDWPNACSHSRDARESLNYALRLAPGHTGIRSVLLSLDIVDATCTCAD